MATYVSTGSVSPITFTGLPIGTYTVSVTATNSVGPSPASSSSSPVTIQTSNRLWLSGYAADNGDPSERAAWQQLVGVPSKAFNQYFDYETSWSQRANDIGNEADQYFTPVSDGSVVNVFTIGLLLSGSGGSQSQNPSALASAANGNDISGWTQIGNALSSHGFNSPSTVLRIGHEANGNWYPWGTNCDATNMANFAKAFQHAAATVRSVCPLVKFELNLNAGYPNGGLSGTQVTAAHYAGDAYVDIVGFDWYNSSHASNTSALNNAVGSPGFGDMPAFANAHGKRFSISEWGLNSDNSTNGANDVPYTMTWMHDTLKQLGVTYPGIVSHDCYFETAGNSLTVNPKCASAYRAAWTS